MLRLGPGMLLALVLCACSSDHSALAVGSGGAPSSSSTSSGGAGGEGGEGGGSTSTFGPTSSSSSVSSSGTGGQGAGGPTELTIVNGVNDADAILLCAIGWPNGENGDAAPWPPAPGGLPFGGAEVVDPLDELLPPSVDVRLHLITGDLAVAATKTCDELVADPGVPGVGAIGLPIIPAATFESGKSLLFVPAGCLGGDLHTDPTEKLACGMSYSPTSPTVSLIALAMSRAQDLDKVLLQVVHASMGMQDVDVRLTPGKDAAPEWQIGSALSVGAIGPKPPFDVLDAEGYGDIATAQLKTYYPADMYPTSAVLFSEIFANSALAPADFVDGETFAAVAIGGWPGLTPPPWAHALTYTLVRTDP